ncbi:MAG: hypothetical protein IPK88_07540 [Saprospiraceae bacterium]|nr:hypothetical protein [Candidatus Defluviibacterium haderslevense]
MNKAFINSKVIIGIVLVLMIPFFAMIVFSFSNNGIIGFKELAIPVRLKEVSTICLRSIIVSCIASLIAYFISYLLVIYTSNKFQIIFLILITLPFIANEAVRVFSWQNILAENGLLNHLLSLVCNRNITLFNSSNGFNIYLTMILTCIPYAVFICTATLKIIPDEYWKVSNDLRLNQVCKFIKVGLPMSITSILASVIITFFISFALSSEVNFLGGATKISTRGFILSLMSANRFDAIFAFGFIILALITLFYLSLLFYLRVKKTINFEVD